MNGDLQQVRTIVAGYKAAHLLEVDRLVGLADATLGTYAKRDLRMLAFKEARVAAEFGTVADLLDQLLRTPFGTVAALLKGAPLPRTTWSFADAGAWVDEDGDDTYTLGGIR